MSEFGLFKPPGPMREACCGGLLSRSTIGRGGTARSVPFATRVCAGGPVTRDDLVDMLTHMAAIETAMVERGLADKALAIAWDLWGGDAGREWAEGFLYQPTAPRLAATPVLAAPALPVDPAWLTGLNTLARAETELLARVHELMEAGVEIAIGRLRSKINNALARPPQALRAQIGRVGSRDALLATMADAPGPLEAIHTIAVPLLARIAPAIEQDETLRAVFVQLGIRVKDLLRSHQRAVLLVLSEAGASVPARDEAAVLMAADLDMAMDLANDELMALVAALARNQEQLAEGEIPTGRVPASLAFRLLSGAGGGDPGDGSRQDWVHVGQGEVLASGVALGVTSLRLLGRAIQGGAIRAAVGTLTVNEAPTLDVITVTTWHWGGSGRPFPPHQRLNGQSWQTEQERAEVCGNSGRFPPVGTLHPGDHRGCSCSYDTELRIVQTKKGTATITVNEPPPMPGLPEPAPVLPKKPAARKPVTRAKTPKKAVKKAQPVGPNLERVDAEWFVPPTNTPSFKPEGWTYSGYRPAAQANLRGQLRFDHTPADQALEIASNDVHRFSTVNAHGQEVHIEVFGRADAYNQRAVSLAGERIKSLSEVYRTSNPNAPVTLRVIPMENETNGYAHLASGKVSVNSTVFRQEPVTQPKTVGRKPSNMSGQGGTLPEGVVTHEWGHAIDMGQMQVVPKARIERLTSVVQGAGVELPEFPQDPTQFRQALRVSLGGKQLPSTYAGQDQYELVAESFIDWVSNGEAASSASLVVREVYGWPAWQ